MKKGIGKKPRERVDYNKDPVMVEAGTGRVVEGDYQGPFEVISRGAAAKRRSESRGISVLRGTCIEGVSSGVGFEEISRRNLRKRRRIHDREFKHYNECRESEQVNECNITEKENYACSKGEEVSLEERARKISTLDEAFLVLQAFLYGSPEKSGAFSQRLAESRSRSPSSRNC